MTKYLFYWYMELTYQRLKWWSCRKMCDSSLDTAAFYVVLLQAQQNTVDNGPRQKLEVYLNNQ